MNEVLQDNLAYWTQVSNTAGFEVSVRSVHRVDLICKLRWQGAVSVQFLLGPQRSFPKSCTFLTCKNAKTLKGKKGNLGQINKKPHQKGLDAMQAHPTKSLHYSGRDCRRDLSETVLFFLKKTTHHIKESENAQSYQKLRLPNINKKGIFLG